MNLFYTKCRDINSKLPEKETSNSRIKEIIDSTFKPIISKMDQQLLQEETTDREEAALIDFLPGRNLRIDLPDEEDDGTGDVNNLNNTEGGEGRQNTNKAMFDDDDDELVESNYHSRDDIKKKSNELVKINATGKKKH